MDYISTLWLACILILAVGVVLYSVPKLIELARLKKLFDDYKDERKVHEGFVPNIGGAALVIAFLVSYSLHPASAMLAGYEYLVASIVILLAIGLKDDLLVIAPYKKFLGELVIATILIFGAGIQITNFGGVLGLYEIPVAASVFVSYLAIIGLINALNLIDGIDGLAASVTMTASFLFGIWFFLAGHYPLFVLSMVFSACYGAFLIFNWSPAKVFMGDTGSLFAGFLLAFLAIHFLNTGLYGEQVAGWQEATPVIAVAVLVIPIYDTLRVFVLRLWSKSSPFRADDNHVHHHLLRHGFSHGQSTIMLISINLFILCAALVMSNYLTVNWLLLMVVALALLLLPTVRVKRRALGFVGHEKLQELLAEIEPDSVHPEMDTRPMGPSLDISRREEETEREPEEAERIL